MVEAPSRLNRRSFLTSTLKYNSELENLRNLGGKSSQSENCLVRRHFDLQTK
ncbi:MAG: hypothetical protein MHPSP_001530, partial [Paramarteilia canceri]